MLIHGAWHASWCWQRVANQLRIMGHRVLTPDLPGHGSKRCPANTITFTDYVGSILQLVKQQSEPVTLVGHSMAGLIISHIAGLIPDHIRELIFVAGYIPKHRDSLLSIARESESRNLSPYLIIDSLQQEIRLQPSPDVATIFFNRCNQMDTQDAMSKLQIQPLQPFAEKVNIDESFNRVVTRSLVCKHDRVLLVADQLRMSERVTDHIVYLEADHAAWFSAESDIIQALIS